MRQHEGFAVARGCNPVYYRVLGDDQGGLPVVFTDGIGCDGFAWKYLERSLAPSRKLIHWHYPGHGRTPAPRSGRRISIADLADCLANVLDANDVPKAVLVGHSMGVQVCLEAFRRHAARVAALVLACGSYGNPLRTFKGRTTLDTAIPYLRFITACAPRLVGAFWRKVVPTKLALALAARFEVNPDLLRLDDFRPYLEHLSNMDPSLFLEMLEHAGRHSARELLPTIDVPTLIIAGDRDGFTPVHLSEEMHRSIASSELLIIEGGTHTAPLERPARVDEAVTRFLARL
ncbi:MAG: alpha/beta hydrolase [Deltaproteobacteria bacterium]|nr:alpha/beta hydrolase [Deltaproteobacteria bacterium]